ncbi:MAG: hypothetical protein MUP58_01340 [Candidatus Nanohaloarchaeota archaeon QJJ-9]|nr:hypothetical protein [Candidatus Nanohaloarchaeota archaeon QJJ-9]
MSEDFKNIVVFVSDSLRYDFFPEELAEESESGIIPTLAPSLHTPTSFASLFTGLSPENHNVRGFIEELDSEEKLF